MDPITFAPIYMERIWGGRELERVYQRALPDAAKPYGESWEIVDREEAQSIVNAGPFAGKSLHDLWTGSRKEIFGEALPDSPRFPILVKILDARDDLSIQVHPPADVAPRLGGEPKTEMWFIANSDPGAKLYVGLKHGITRADFEQAIEQGTVADAVHVLTPRAGDSIFLPSGRLHAIGGGFLIHEIQQNSDTTYRVFDWNRAGLDGKPRQLHVAESLESIDFNDFAPHLDPPSSATLATCPHFKVDRARFSAGETVSDGPADRFSILSIVNGSLRGPQGRQFRGGDTLLVPVDASPLIADGAGEILRITLPGC